LSSQNPQPLHLHRTTAWLARRRHRPPSTLTPPRPTTSFFCKRERHHDPCNSPPPHLPPRLGRASPTELTPWPSWPSPQSRRRSPRGPPVVFVCSFFSNARATTIASGSQRRLLPGTSELPITMLIATRSVAGLRDALSFSNLFSCEPHWVWKLRHQALSSRPQSEPLSLSPFALRFAGGNVADNFCSSLLYYYVMVVLCRLKMKVIMEGLRGGDFVEWTKGNNGLWCFSWNQEGEGVVFHLAENRMRKSPLEWRRWKSPWMKEPWWYFLCLCSVHFLHQDVGQGWKQMLLPALSLFSHHDHGQLATIPKDLRSYINLFYFFLFHLFTHFFWKGNKTK